MTWYYAVGDQQAGPESEEALWNLVQTGVVTAETLVWREGMAGWQPLSQAAPHLLPAESAPAPPPVSLGGAACQECGRVFPVSEMVHIRGASVCAECKPLFLQKVQEGVVTGNSSAELQRLLQIAKAQRGVNVLIVIMLLCLAVVMAAGAVTGGTAARAGGPPAAGVTILSGIFGLAYLVVWVMQIIYVYRLAAALKCGSPILWLLGVMCLSCIGLILLLILSSKATKELRAAGFKVGLLGGNPRDVEAAMNR